MERISRAIGANHPKDAARYIGNTVVLFLAGSVVLAGAYLASRFFPQTLLPMGLASAGGSLFSSIVCGIAYAWLKKQQKAQLLPGD